MTQKINVVYATADGALEYDSELAALGANGEEYWPLSAEDLIPLPAGATLFYLPGRAPLGLADDGTVEFIAEQGVSAVAAILPQGYTRLFLPAYQRAADVPRLPLFGYTAVAFKDGQLWVTARRTDDLAKWDPCFYNTPELSGLIAAKLAAHPENRILHQLAHCAKEYHCFTAQNIFYGRWEGGVPISPSCNARCRVYLRAGCRVLPFAPGAHHFCADGGGGGRGWPAALGFGRGDPQLWPGVRGRAAPGWEGAERGHRHPAPENRSRDH